MSSYKRYAVCNKNGTLLYSISLKSDQNILTTSGTTVDFDHEITWAEDHLEANLFLNNISFVVMYRGGLHYLHLLFIVTEKKCNRYDTVCNLLFIMFLSCFAVGHVGCDTGRFYRVYRNK